MACLAAVDTSLYEAAKIDGASMFQRILHIDIPELVPMIVLQLIMSVGNLMNVGFEKVLLLQTELNKATSDIIAVYVYEQGIINAKYSYSTAVGLFNTVVNIILLIIVNRIAKKGGGRQLCVKGRAVMAKNIAASRQKQPGGLSDKVSDIVLVVICAAVMLIVAYPLYYVLVASFSDPLRCVRLSKTFLLPSQFTLKGYQAVFADSALFSGFMNSIKYTVIGTIYSVVMIILWLTR